MNEPSVRILVAGVGNVLRADDGFGPAVLRALGDDERMADVVLAEFGTAGIGLVHRLMDGYDALLIVDAVDRGAAPGTLFNLEPSVPDVDAMSASTRRSVAADMHQTVPEKVLIVARAAGVLPPYVRIIGCQPLELDELTMTLSEPAAAAVEEAADLVRAIVGDLQHKRSQRIRTAHAG